MWTGWQGTKNTYFFQDVLRQNKKKKGLFISPENILSIVLQTCPGTALAQMNFGWQDFGLLLPHSWTPLTWTFWMQAFSLNMTLPLPLAFKVSFSNPPSPCGLLLLWRFLETGHARTKYTSIIIAFCGHSKGPNMQPGTKSQAKWLFLWSF